MSISIQSLLWIILLMLSSIGLTFYIFVWKWARGLMRRKPPHMVDVTDTDFFIPAPVQVAARELEELGFQRVTVIEVHLPEHQAVSNVWYYINLEKDVSVELIEYGDKAAVQFTTWYDDDSVVETSYPIGENIDTNNFRSHFSKTGISDAYHLHREQMHKFAMKKFSIPIPINSLDKYTECEAKYQIKHKPIKFRRGLMRGLGLFTSANILVAMFLVSTMTPDLLRHLSQPVIMLGWVITGLAVASLFYFTAKKRHHAGR